MGCWEQQDMGKAMAWRKGEGGLRQAGWASGTDAVKPACRQVGAVRWCLTGCFPYCRSVAARAISQDNEMGAKGLTGDRYWVKQGRQERAWQRTLVASN